MTAEIQALKTRLTQGDVKIQALEARPAVRMDVKIRELETRLARPPQLGCWQSHGVHATYFKTWTTVISAPPDGLFAMSDSHSKITVLQAGIYHVHGMATSNGNGQCISIYLNGTQKTTNCITGSGCTSHEAIPFDLTIRLTANQYIQIRTSSHSTPGAIYNSLTIEKKD